jgi:hypothetical protein
LWRLAIASTAARIQFADSGLLLSIDERIVRIDPALQAATSCQATVAAELPNPSLPTDCRVFKFVFNVSAGALPAPSSTV